MKIDRRFLYILNESRINKRVDLERKNKQLIKAVRENELDRDRKHIINDDTIFETFNTIGLSDGKDAVNEYISHLCRIKEKVNIEHKCNK